MNRSQTLTIPAATLTVGQVLIDWRFGLTPEGKLTGIPVERRVAATSAGSNSLFVDLTFSDGTSTPYLQDFLVEVYA